MPGGQDPVEELKRTKNVDREAFQERVREEADVIRTHLNRGTFDSEQVTVGLEYEFYAVDRSGKHLRRLPRSLLECLGFEKELGLHNAELSTAAHPLNEPGAEALRREVEAILWSLEQHAALDGLRVVSDGMWTIGPNSNTATGYLTDATHEDGLTLAHNVSNAVRYHGFGSVDEGDTIGGVIDLPGVSLSADSAGPVSLTTSIQPHYQCRNADVLPEFFAIALRIAGPLLALGVNSPFFPPDLYDDPGPDRAVLLEESHAENRIPVYEQMMNPEQSPPKVRFPRDVETPTEAVDRIVEDRLLLPAEISSGERFDDAFVHFRHKHGSYWRWVRPVFDGATEAQANARVEFRPLPGQPTIPDTVAFVAAVGGLLTAIFYEDHPAVDLPWEAHATTSMRPWQMASRRTSSGSRPMARERRTPTTSTRIFSTLRRPASSATASPRPKRGRGFAPSGNGWPPDSPRRAGNGRRSPRNSTPATTRPKRSVARNGPTSRTRRPR
ncbi:MAG: hypothetical protein V5A43_04395 [Haloarculaceae archaeon]